MFIIIFRVKEASCHWQVIKAAIASRSSSSPTPTFEGKLNKFGGLHESSEDHEKMFIIRKFEIYFLYRQDFSKPKFVGAFHGICQNDWETRS